MAARVVLLPAAEALALPVVRPDPALLDELSPRLAVRVDPLLADELPLDEPALLLVLLVECAVPLPLDESMRAAPLRVEVLSLLGDAVARLRVAGFSAEPLGAAAGPLGAEVLDLGRVEWPLPAAWDLRCWSEFLCCLARFTAMMTPTAPAVATTTGHSTSPTSPAAAAPRITTVGVSRRDFAPE
ncbi:hypothetical protein [Nocardia sp. NPDC127526]|uniref:hypothetical protein n=1 Tax=Nocardia sp. NPDC127526 TaxID=3345393 RepID=UPI003632B787